MVAQGRRTTKVVPDPDSLGRAKPQVALQDGAGDGQSQSQAAGLGCEEGLIMIRASWSCGIPGPVSVTSIWARVSLRSAGYRQTATPGHGFGRVTDQIAEDDLELAGVSGNREKSVSNPDIMI